MSDNINNFKEFTIKEFFTFLDEKRRELKLQNDEIKSKFILYKNCFEYVPDKDHVLCTRSSVKKMIKTTNGKKTFAQLLENIFGEDFFCLTDEEIEQYERNGYFTVKSLYELVKPIIGNRNGVSISLPQNYADFVELINSCLTVVCDDNIYDKVKEPYSALYCNIEQTIGANFKDKNKEAIECDVIINCINTIISLYKSKKLITYNEAFLNLINKKMYKLKEREDGLYDCESYNFASIISEYIDRYNIEIKKVQNEKELKNKTNKYYKKLIKTKLDKLSKDDFPNYADDDVVEVYRNLISRLNDASEKNDALCDIRTITEMMYAGYFKSEYYDEEKVFGTNKNY